MPVPAARTNKETGEHLSFRYTAEREINAFINLDTEAGLLGVDCEEGSLTLLVENTFSASEYVFNSSSPRRLVYGGSAWGCQTKNNATSPIFKSIASVPVISNDSSSTLSTVTFQVKDESPFTFLGR